MMRVDPLPKSAPKNRGAGFTVNFSAPKGKSAWLYRLAEGVLSIDDFLQALLRRLWARLSGR